MGGEWPFPASVWVGHRRMYMGSRIDRHRSSDNGIYFLQVRPVCFVGLLEDFSWTCVH